MNYVHAIGRLIALLSLLWAGQAGAQVANDDCAGGIAQGVSLLPNQSNQCNSPGGAFGRLIIDSTDFAVPNFPYPTIPSPCAGYTSAVSVGGKDRWYSFRVSCFLEFTAECSDSCHISFWSGGDCAVLLPRACYTLLPNQPMSGIVYGNGTYLVLDTMSMQISDDGGGQDLNYRICLMNPYPVCFSVYVVPGPTPTTCFTYETMIVPCTSSGSGDGSIGITVQQGNGPFDILWNTGETSWTIDSLSQGAYSFGITDANGCTEFDTLEITTQVLLGADAFSTGGNSLFHDARTNELVIDVRVPGLAEGHVRIRDAMGRLIWSAPFHGRSTRYALPRLAPGLHLASLDLGSTSVVFSKFITTSDP